MDSSKYGIGKDLLNKIEEVLYEKKWKEVKKKIEKAAKKALEEGRSKDIWHIITFIQLVIKEPDCLNSISDKENPNIDELKTSRWISSNPLEIPTEKESRYLLREVFKIMLLEQ